MCGSQDWTGGNVTGGGGPAACADSNASGQTDIDVGNPALEMDTYLCTPALDLTQLTNPALSFLVNYQTVDNSDAFENDMLEVLIGFRAPNFLTLPNYASLGNVLDHLDTTLVNSPSAAVAANIAGYNFETEVYACFHYRGTNAWFAQIDNVALRGNSCEPIEDADQDGVMDDVDNCTFLTNASQLDTDGDGHGNRCDADFNDDCVVSAADLGLFRTLFFQPNNEGDLDGNGTTGTIDLGLFRTLFFTTPGPSANGLCD